MQTPSPFLPIPSSGSGNAFPRQAGFGAPLSGDGAQVTGASGLSAMMRNNGWAGDDSGVLTNSAPPGQSPSSNPHSGFHPGSFGGPLSFSALALGATQPGSSPYSSSMAMSISPPRWQPGSLGGFGSSSFVGSVGQLGTSFGRQAEGRERELEAKYVKDFTCCDRRLSGLHELLEHYEEEHANLTPDVRMAALNQAVQASGTASITAKKTFASNMSIGHGDVPTTPGMMDMDMEMEEPAPTPATLLHQASVTGISVNATPAAASPWSAAFRPPSLQPPACVPPSVLSYAPPAPLMTPQASQSGSQPISIQQQQPSSTPSTPNGSQPKNPLSAEQIQARVLKKAQKKAEREAAETGDEEHPGEKRFRCPIEGCGKVYKQANGLKYHLTRSINSGHGNVAAMGGLMALLGEEEK